MSNRLTARTPLGRAEFINRIGLPYSLDECRSRDKAAESLAAYEDLEEQGQLVRVVRCINCKYYNIPCCTCRKLNITSGENGYCIHGLSKNST